MKEKSSVVGKVGAFSLVRRAFVGGVKVSGPEPKSPMKENDKVIGVLTDPGIRALYQQSFIYAGKLKEVATAHKKSHEDGTSTEEGCKQFKAQVTGYSKCADLFRKLFWLGVRSAFPEISQADCGIRDGWKVVLLEEPAAQEIKALGSCLPPADHPSKTWFADLRAILVADEKGLTE